MSMKHDLVDKNKMKTRTRHLHNTGKTQIERKFSGLIVTHMSCSHVSQGDDSLWNLEPKIWQTVPEILKDFRRKYPEFFTVSDSIDLGDGRFHYSGRTRIVLDLTEASSIAWETTLALPIAKEMNYECLYELEGLYNLQLRTKKEVDKAADALQREDLKDLIRILKFLQQFYNQLKEGYGDALNSFMI